MPRYVGFYDIVREGYQPMIFDTPMTIIRIEFEIMVLDCPPHLCASRCPAYNRDPCGACEMRDVLSVDTEKMEIGGN